MSFLYSIAQWIYNAIKKSVEFVVSVPGLISAGVVSICSVIASLFSGFSYWTDISQWLIECATRVQDLISGTSSLFQNLIAFFAVDRFAAVASVCFTATVGVTLAIFVTMLGSVVVLLPTVYIIKGAIRAISIFTAGFIKP